jgi:hypothetical protein
MDNQLKEFEELFIDNALLKVYNQTWRIKPKMEGMMAYRKLQKNISKTIWR